MKTEHSFLNKTTTNLALFGIAILTAVFLRLLFNCDTNESNIGVFSKGYGKF